MDINDNLNKFNRSYKDTKVVETLVIKIDLYLALLGIFLLIILTVASLTGYKLEQNKRKEAEQALIDCMNGSYRLKGIDFDGKRVEVRCYKAESNVNI